MKSSEMGMRSWVVFLLTVLVLVGAIAVFVSYYLNVPPDVARRVTELEGKTSKLRAVAPDSDSEALQRELQRYVDVKLAAMRQECETGLSSQKSAYEKRLADLRRELLAAILEGGSGTSDASRVKELARDLKALQANHGALNTQVESQASSQSVLQKKVASVTLPRGVSLASFVRDAVETRVRREGQRIDGLDTRVGTLERNPRSTPAPVTPPANVPSGTIIAWYRTGSVPSGWVECNGERGTPNLGGRFLLGASSTRRVGSAGGTDRPLDGHWHHRSTWDQQGGQFQSSIYVRGVLGPDRGVYEFGAYQSSTPKPVLPPYVTVRYIMKL